MHIHQHCSHSPENKNKTQAERDKIKNNPGLIQIPFPQIHRHCSANIPLNYAIQSSQTARIHKQHTD